MTQLWAGRRWTVRKKKPKKIVADIRAHVLDLGDPYKKWYAGIATDPDDCLFRRHCVRREDDGTWIVRKAANEAKARKAEKKLHKTGFDGGPGGGDETTRFVYAYKMASHTSEG